MTEAVHRAESTQQSHWSVAFGIFVFILAVYGLTYSGYLHVVDEFFVLGVTESLSRGHLDTNQVASLGWDFSPVEQVGAFGPSGDVYCKKGIGVSLSGLPLLALARLSPAVGGVHAALLANAVVTALTGSVLFLYLVLAGIARRAALACALLFGLGTLAWPYARSYFAEPVPALGMLLAVLGCSRFHRTFRLGAAFIAGLGAGIALSAVSASIVTLPPLAVGLIVSSLIAAGKRRWSNVWRVVAGWSAGLSGPAIVIVVYNLLRFSSPWATGWALSSDESGRGVGFLCADRCAGSAGLPDGPSKAQV